MHARQTIIWLILSIGVIGALLTGAATRYVLDSSDVEAEARFSLAVTRVSQSLTNRMIQYEQGLVAGAALIAAVDPVNRAAWARFVAGQNIRTRFPGIQAMGLAGWVPESARDDHVAKIRATDLPSYAIRPPGDRATYLPIVFNEPYEGRNRTVIGFDMLSEPIRRAAITRAASFGEPSISGMVVLAGENAEDRPPGFVFYVPALDAAGDLKGMVFAPFRVRDLIEAVTTEASPPGLFVTLRDRADVLFADPAFPNSPHFSIAKDLSVAGRIWRLHLAGDDRLLAMADRQRAWVVAGSGATVTIALIGSLIALYRSRVAEARFRIFADLGSDWVWEQDADQRFTYFNDPQRLYQGATNSPVGGTRADLFNEVGEPSERDRHQDLLARMSRHEPIHDFEYRSRTRSAATAVIRLSAQPIFNVRGRFKGYAGIAKDVTRETIRDAALRSATQAAEAANIAKSNFLATMSHELRTPLNAIIGFADIIERKRFGLDKIDRYFDYAADIRLSGEQLLALVNDILDLAKIESGKMELARAPVAVAATVAVCGVTVSGDVTRKNLTMTTDIAEDAIVFADPRSLRQILLNLMSNAVKFTPPGGAISVTAIGSGEDVVVTVQDNGAGISPEALEQIFTPFFQADSTISTRHGGTGLGLTISKLLAESMGGSIEIVSALGAGTTVTLRLPKPENADAWAPS